MADDFSPPIRPPEAPRRRRAIASWGRMAATLRAWLQQAGGRLGSWLRRAGAQLGPQLRRAGTRAAAFRPPALHTRLRAGALAAGILLPIALLALPPRSATPARPPTIHHEHLAAALPPPSSPPTQRVRTTTIRRGDSASSALHRLGFSSGEVLAMARAARDLYPLTRVHPGQRLTRIDHRDATRLTMEIDPLHTLELTRGGRGGWRAATGDRTVTSRRVVASGVIRENLFSDAARAGLDDRTTMNLVDIFSWDIDFARNLRKGDRFALLLEERFDDRGRHIGDTILAAEFVNRGRRYRAIRFTDDHGHSAYYAPDGTSMRKNYLKAPVKFTRISSRFTLARKHPILGYTRAHRGVDYAAPIGTPIHAVGAGRIVYLGRRGGYGRFILIRHRNRHHGTAYGHLHGYARGLHRGSWVEQGQVIGYVGMSGLATGPHLHFEFRIDGRAVDPLTIERTPAHPIPRRLRRRFARVKQELLAALEQPPINEVAWR